MESNWQMYYWAAGLFLITLAVVLRVGLHRLSAIPASAKAFVAVSVAAAAQGFVLGATPTNVLKGLYASLLLVAYFGVAVHAGSEGLLVRRIQTFGPLCVFFFLVYYAALFSRYGFHREVTSVGTEATLLAVILFVYAAERAKLSWFLCAAALLLVPVLVFERRNVLTFLFAVALTFAMKLRSRKLRALSYSAAILVALPAIVPSVTQIVAQRLRETPAIQETLPPGARPDYLLDAGSLEDRTVEFFLAADALKSHPLLGVGLGAEFRLNLTEGMKEAQYIDNGWAYPFYKTGLLGAAAFIWFLAVVLRGISRRSLALSVCLLSATAVAMFTEPIFFNFQTAPFVGSFAGLLFAQQRLRQAPGQLAGSLSALGRQRARGMLPQERIAVLDRT